MVSGTKFHCTILKREPWSMSKIKSNGKIKPFHEGKIKTQKPFARIRVS